MTTYQEHYPFSSSVTPPRVSSLPSSVNLSHTSNSTYNGRVSPCIPKLNDLETHSISEDSLVVPQTWFIDTVIVHSSKVLGKGSFGTVCLGEWLGCPVAVKKLHEIFFDTSVSDSERRGILKAFAREVNILFQLKHPNIVLFYGLHDSAGKKELTLSSDTCLVQELLQCSLSSRNRQLPHLTYRNIVDLSLGITGGLRYLHERLDPIVHRDLASKNILLSQIGIPKIADLGVAKVISSTHKFIQHSRQPGTELYMPPEVKVEGVQYDSRVDIYSLGVIILEMCVGRDPTASEAFRVYSGDGGGLQIVPEVERRRRDLQDLGELPLRPLVLDCLARKDERPNAEKVFCMLKDLQEHRYYQSQPEIPVMIDQMVLHTSHDLTSHCQKLEEKMRILQSEKEDLQRQFYANEGVTKRESRPEELNNYSFPMSEIEQLRSQKAQLEKSLLVGSDSDHDRVKLLEATIRSRNSEISSLRERNIILEQEIATFQSQYSNGFHNPVPFGLTARGVPSSHPNVNGTSSSSTPSLETDFKQVKRQLEKYKNLAVELDSKLKTAKLDLSRYETRQTGMDVQARYENEALRSENQIIRSEVDRLRRECSHYQRQAHYGSRY